MQRRRDLLVPDGNTVLEAGDELVIIGPADDVEAIRRVASGRANEPGVRRRRGDGVEEPPGSVDAGTGGP